MFGGTREFDSSILTKRDWCNGNTSDFHSDAAGSIPASRTSRFGSFAVAVSRQRPMWSHNLLNLVCLIKLPLTCC